MILNDNNKTKVVAKNIERYRLEIEGNHHELVIEYYDCNQDWLYYSTLNDAIADILRIKKRLIAIEKGQQND